MIESSVQRLGDKMKAKEFLLQISSLDNRIRNKIAEKEQLRVYALGMSHGSDGDRVQSSGDLQKMETAVVKYVDLENEINKKIAGAIEKRSEVIEVIEQIPSDQYNVLYSMYVQGKSLDDVADYFGKSYSWASQMQSKGFKSVQAILDRKEDENGRKTEN